jgi:hypothetical protein
MLKLTWLAADCAAWAAAAAAWTAYQWKLLCKFFFSNSLILYR